MSEAINVVGPVETTDDVRPPLVKWWDMPLILILPVVATAFLMALTVLYFIVVANGQGVTAEEFQTWMAEPEVERTVGLVFFLVFYASVAGTIVIITKKRKYALRATYFRPVSVSNLLLASGLAIVIGLFLFATEQFLSEEVKAAFDTFYASTLAENGWSYLLLGGLIAAPFVEEMFFRGVVFTWWREKTNLVVAVIVSAAAFTLIHFYFLIIPGVAGWIASGQVFLFGVLAALLVIWTRSLWPSIVAYSTFNLIAIGSTYFAL